MALRSIQSEQRVPAPPPVPGFVGTDPLTVALRTRINALGARSSTALICGESGTGKELVARQIHGASPRCARPFVTVDCTTLHDTLLESQLFGHVRGAFTGAETATLGLFRAADGGTLFLDEVGELDLPMQAKLLRCIQEKAVVPLGGVSPIAVDTRVLAATHRDLAALVRRGQFRADLFFRLDVVRLEVPALRARPADVLPLAEHFLEQQATIYSEPRRRLTPAAQDALLAYAWPGNVRELRNAIEHALAYGAGEDLGPEDFPAAVARAVTAARPAARCPRVVPLQVAERCLIRRALKAASGNQTLAAQMLGVERHRLARMVRRHGLEKLQRRRH